MLHRTHWNRWEPALVLAIALLCSAEPARAQDDAPIAYAGHGAFFDRNGKQIEPTQAFVADAQKWYRAKLLAGLDGKQRKAYAAHEADVDKAVAAEAAAGPQARLLARNSALEWLAANSKVGQADHRLRGHLQALAYALSFQLPAAPGSGTVERRETFSTPVELQRRLDTLRKRKAASGFQVQSATMNAGQLYLNECAANKVPIPPPINRMDPAGLTGWKSQGFIPTASQFIVGTPAEVRTYKSTSPEGMCYALPRYTDATLTQVELDGVICMSRETSKVCFWDNQMNKVGFTFPAGTQIPIGVPDLSVDPAGRYQAGGFELLGGSGQVCTDCHAGENPYITHPRINLAPGLRWDSLSEPPQSLPTFAPNRYDPIVASAWPQNRFSQAESTVPSQCKTCHTKGDAGRFPHLSNELPGYCGMVLARAINATMPPGSPGSAAAAANTFMNTWCNAAPSASSADTGDPHITTTNGVNYDFQAAGEFIALRHADAGFELQIRQSPVLTTFIPQANPHTGLASCVSVNTAVAMRLGKRRVTFQPLSGELRSDGKIRMRIDGEPIARPGKVDLGGGNVIEQTTASGATIVQAADGTRVLVTPVNWASQGYTYLDVHVLQTPAREGVMGPILAPDWLPFAPDGSSFGPRPALVLDRHTQLNQKFADAWRVATSTSLFDYVAGTSSDTFTDRSWPPEPGKGCSSTTAAGPSGKVREPRPDLAKKVCRGIKDKAIFDNCVFDVTTMGDAVFAVGHRRADQVKAQGF